jgi:hypothetical protein
LKDTVGKILTSVQATEVHLAKVPTFSQTVEMIKPVESRVATLETDKAKVQGGWKLATIAGGIGAGVISAGYYVVEGIKAIFK